MLHVVLLILKIIGIILAALLGLLLLILLLLLFVPIRYKGRLQKEKELLVRAKVTWLLHMVSVPVVFQEGTLSARIKLFGITIKNLTEDEEELKQSAEELFRDTEDAAAQGEEQILETEDPPLEQTGKDESDFSLEGMEDSKGPENTESQRILENPFGEEDVGQEEVREQGISEEKGLPNSLIRRLVGKIKVFFLKIFGIWQKIKNLKYTFRRFCVKIKRGIRKYRDTKEFLLDERTKKAVSHCISEGKLLLARLLPKKMRGELSFGTEDPALTGQILGGISIFYPVFKDNVKVYPDFERSVLEGELFVKGSFRMVTAALILWRLWRDKNIRYVYHKLRN